ncbi:hypothetical protein E1265_28045 [Streptomyces sp. 8K308]|nr:hypothetical protein E1265_28045 [Streptomyces sp. 8K308]
MLSRTAHWRSVPPLRPGLRQRAEVDDPFGRYVITTFVKGNMGPYGAARHIPGVGGHELSYTVNRHFSIVLLNEAIADLVNARARLDISQARGDGTAVAADGTHMDTYLDNLLAETSVRYGKPGGSSMPAGTAAGRRVGAFTRPSVCWQRLLRGLARASRGRRGGRRRRGKTRVRTWRALPGSGRPPRG